MRHLAKIFRKAAVPFVMVLPLLLNTAVSAETLDPPQALTETELSEIAGFPVKVLDIASPTLLEDLERTIRQTPMTNGAYAPEKYVETIINSFRELMEQSGPDAVHYHVITPILATRLPIPDGVRQSIREEFGADLYPFSTCILAVRNEPAAKERLLEQIALTDSQENFSDFPGTDVDYHNFSLLTEIDHCNFMLNTARDKTINRYIRSPLVRQKAMESIGDYHATLTFRERFGEAANGQADVADGIIAARALRAIHTEHSDNYAAAAAITISSLEKGFLDGIGQIQHLSGLNRVASQSIISVLHNHMSDADPESIYDRAKAARLILDDPALLDGTWMKRFVEDSEAIKGIFKAYITAVELVSGNETIVWPRNFMPPPPPLKSG